MTKYYAYHEPNDYGGDVQVIQTLKEIVKERTIIAELYSKGYPSAEDALYDWLVVNWGYECDKNGNPIKSGVQNE